MQLFVPCLGLAPQSNQQGMGFSPWDGAMNLKFVPCPIVSNFTSHSRNFMKLSAMIKCSRQSKHLEAQCRGVVI